MKIDGNVVTAHVQKCMSAYCSCWLAAALLLSRPLLKEPWPVVAMLRCAHRCGCPPETLCTITTTWAVGSGAALCISAPPSAQLLYFTSSHCSTSSSSSSAHKHSS